MTRIITSKNFTFKVENKGTHLEFSLSTRRRGATHFLMNCEKVINHLGKPFYDEMVKEATDVQVAASVKSFWVRYFNPDAITIGKVDTAVRALYK